jgi:hypothetical protein
MYFSFHCVFLHKVHYVQTCEEVIQEAIWRFMVCLFDDLCLKQYIEMSNMQTVLPQNWERMGGNVRGGTGKGENTEMSLELLSPCRIYTCIYNNT